MAKQRRTFTRAFKVQAVKLITEQGRLRAENKRLLMERDILKKATAYFARESS
jgi:transposase-like protein